MNFHADMTQHYLDVSTRLRGRPALPGTDLLPRDALQRRSYTWSEPHLCLDPVPDQREIPLEGLVWLQPTIEQIAARRALCAFARMREQTPDGRPVRQLQSAIAAAFKMDHSAVFGRSSRKAPARARQVAMAMAGGLTGFYRNQIAVCFHRNHATVHFAEKKFSWLLDGATSQIGGA